MKGGYVRPSTTNEATGLASAIPAAQLLARRVPIDQPQRALDAAIKRLPPGASGGTVQEFAVVTPGPDKASALAIGDCLAGYLPALKTEFDIEPSAYTVTVYTADSTEEVYDYARKLHGLNLPPGVVAYSVPEDMSLVAVAYPDQCGSIAHELVHLLIKRKLPVSPVWLEEGLASEIAVAVPTQSGFQFGYSWRDDTLKRYLSSRPAIGQLIQMPWSSFSVTDNSGIENVAAIQATAAVFIRYLDARGKLSAVYFAVRDNHIGPGLTGFTSYRKILEQQLGMTIGEVDRDFSKWLVQQNTLNSERHRTSAPDAGNSPAGLSSIPCRIPAANAAPTPTRSATPNEPAQVQLPPMSSPAQCSEPHGPPAKTAALKRFQTSHRPGWVSTLRSNSTSFGAPTLR